MRDNPRGVHLERWRHAYGCGCWFNIARHTVTHEVLAVYEALRPGSSTPGQLTAMAGELAARGLPRCAALLTEAAEVYARRGLSA